MLFTSYVSERIYDMLGTRPINHVNNAIYIKDDDVRALHYAEVLIHRHGDTPRTTMEWDWKLGYYWKIVIQWGKNSTSYI